MSKITPAQVKEQQFLPEHFNPVVDFDIWLQGVINTQEGLLKIRIGSLYDSADTAIAPQVQAAALAMVCDDLTQRRILRVSGNVNQDTSSVIRALLEMRKSYQDAAASALSSLVNGAGQPDSTGYSGAVVVTGSTTSPLTRFP